MPNYHPWTMYAARVFMGLPIVPPRKDEFIYVTDRGDLRNRDHWWIYFDERTGLHVAIRNPHMERDEDGWAPTHDGVAVLPEFADTREYWTHGWHVPIVAPTVSDEAGDEYDADVYDALREADWSD